MAIVGCGRIGSEFSDDPRVRGIYSHAGAYHASSRAALVAVCDVDAARAQRCARRWNTRAYASLEQLLADEHPEIVSVCTPDETHASVLGVVLACSSVRGVLAEKPLATDANEAEALASQADRQGRRLAVNYLRRYATGHQRLKEAIVSGELGAIESVAGLYAGGLLHNGSHWLDLARWLLGEVERVQAWQRTGEAFDVRLEFAGGATGLLQSYPAAGFSLFEMDIVGTHGRARLVESGHRIELYAAGDSPEYTGFRAMLPLSAEGGGLECALPNAVEDLIDSVESGRVPRCSGADGVAALRLVEAAVRSASLGRPVDMERRA